MNRTKKWVEFVLAMFVILVMCKFAFAGTEASIYERWRPGEVKGWTVYANDDDVDESAYEMITELDTTYAQLSAEGSIEVLSAEAADTTQTVTVYGINSSGKKCKEEFTLAGVTVQTSSTTFRYIDQVEVDIECAGAITIRDVSDTLITSIPIGQLDAQMAQHFNGEYKSYITGWSARCTSTTGSIVLQLRWYPDDADCLDAGDGYQILDSIVFTNVIGSDSGIMGNPIEVPAGGWLAVYGIGGAANSDCSVTIQGVDIKQ